MKRQSELPDVTIVLGLPIVWKVMYYRSLSSMRTALKEVERQRLLNERLDMVALRTANAVLISNHDGQVEWVNEGFTRLTGYTLDDVRGRRRGGIVGLTGASPEQVRDDGSSLFAALHPDDIAHVQERLARSGQMLTNWNEEFRLVEPSGSVRWLSAHSTPTRDAHGCTHWYGYVSDRTAAREAQQRVEEVSRSLEEAEAMARLGSWTFELATGSVYRSKQMYKIYPPNASDAIEQAVALLVETCRAARAPRALPRLATQNS
jgi:PAS domain S-box-containing protein